MSKEYIERSALFENLHAVGGCDASPGTWAAGYDAGIDLAIDILRKQPTINPEDCRPHGRWIASKKCNHKPCRIKNLDKWVVYECSECGYSNGRKQSNYCPNCGAKMDGKEDE